MRRRFRLERVRAIRHSNTCSTRSWPRTFYVPQMVFIDRKGVIRGQYGGTDAFLGDQQEANMRGMVEKLLAEPGGAKPVSKHKSAKKVS